MTYYIGGEVNQSDILGAGNSRYFYALRRTDEGTLYFSKVDQLISDDIVAINITGPASGDFQDFEWGVDFFDGRLSSDHSRPYANLFFDQFRWDSRNMYYYINAQGSLVVRINRPYSYA